MTICVKCKWHLYNGRNRNVDVWYNHSCTHPSVENPETTDPVTGKKTFYTKNDLGTTIYVDEQYPYCQRLNDGNCSMYEEKK